MISYKHKFIFLHVPKTGGRSIEKFFKSKNILHDSSFYQITPDPHHSLGEYSDMLNINNFFKFAFVRNPFDRVLSEYFYIKRWNGCLCSKEDFNKKFYSFKRFIKYGGLECCWKWHANNQCEMIFNKDDKLDFIGKFENLQEHFNAVCDNIGISQQQLPYKNKSKHKHYTEYYDDETKQIVAEKYAKDIEYFGYEFGE